MRKRLGPLPGGADKYVSILQKCLEFVRESNPSEEQLKEWFPKTFPSVKREKTAKYHINTIKSLGLIIKTGDKFLLSNGAKEFLKTHDSNLIYQALNAKYTGVHDIIELLYEKPQTPNEICSFLKKEKTYCATRLNWLRSMEYVVKDGLQYGLTREGRNIVESEIEIEEKIPEHDELLDHIVEAGKLWGLFSQKEYPINDYFVDVAWKQNEAARNPFAVFEVHLEGDLFRALVKLKYARTNLRCEPFLYTTKKQMLKAQSLVSTAFPEMADVIRILHWTDINELEKLARKYKETMVNKMKFRGVLALPERARRIPQRKGKTKNSS